MAIIRIPIELGDPSYFCNRSWTLSYNFVTNSFVSFHSYLPNWYIGESGFFYSGINGCCDDFDFIVGISEEESDCYLRGATAFVDIFPLPDCDFSVTIEDAYDCGDMEGTATIEDCTLEGNAITYNEPPCVRPDDLSTFYFIYGYTEDLIETVSSGSHDDACSAVAYLNSFEDSYLDVVFNVIPVQLFSMSVGEYVYLINGSNDCECIPDGWYFTEETALANNVIHVVDCNIVSIETCGTTTSTTTESPECYLEAEALIIVFPEECLYNGGTAIIIVE